MNPLLLRALMARAAPMVSRFAGPGGTGVKAQMINPPDVPNLPTAPFSESNMGKDILNIGSFFKDMSGRVQQHAAARDQLGVDESGFITAFPSPAAPSDHMKTALAAEAAKPTFDPFAGASLPPHQGPLVGQAKPAQQPAFDPNSIPGFNPALPNMANPQMSLDSLGPNVQARPVSDGNGGMMNDFYTQGPSASGPDLVKKFMSYMNNKNAGTA